MPGPTTASLDDDIRELRTSLKEVLGAIGESRIEAARDHAEAMQQIKVLGAKVDTYAGISKWAAAGLATLMVAVLGSVGTAIWWASRIDYRISQVELHQAKQEGPKR